MGWSIRDQSSPFADPRRILSCLLEVPAEGAWWLDATIDRPDPLPARVIVTLGEDAATGEPIEWRGYTHAEAPDGGRAVVRIVGGAGGLSTPVVDRYEQSPLTAVDGIARGLCALGGETLGSAPTTTLGSWQRLRGTVGTALDDLCRAMALRWRVAASGSVVLYDPASVPIATSPGVLRDRNADASLYGVRGFALEAPCALGGARIEHVTGELTEKGQATIHARTTSPRTLLRALGDQRPHGRVFAGRMLAQSGSTVDVEIQRPSSGGRGPGDTLSSGQGWSLRGIPLWPGVPGLTATLRTGAGLLVLFLDDDPRRAVAIPAPYGEPGDVLTLAVEAGPSLRLDATTAALDAPVVKIGAGGHPIARGDATAAWIGAILSGTAGGNPLVVIPPIPFPSPGDIITPIGEVP